MIDASLPDSSELTKDDFLGSGWKAVVGGDNITSLSNFWLKFQRASSTASERGDKAEAKVLLLLANACSMGLSSPESLNNPFSPRLVGDGISSPTPEWFTETDINLFSEILKYVDCPILRGRLSDLTWIKKIPRDVSIALKAIDSYRSLDLNAETWVTDVGDCWRRAIAMTKRLGTVTGSRANELESSIKDKLDQATKDDQFFGHWLGRTLREFGLGRQDEEVIAKKLVSLAQAFEREENFLAALEYHKLGGEWFGDANQLAKQWDTKVAEAEAWAKAAEARTAGQNPSALVVADFYDNAIQTYREIPGVERGPRNVDIRIKELEQLQADAGKQALSEMTTVSTTGVDISNKAEQARKAVAGKQPLEALETFASIHPFVDVTELRESARQNLREHPFLAFIAQTMITDDGRVAAKSPGTSNPDNPDEGETAIWVQMIREYGTRVDLIVGGIILPTLETLHLEHHFRESDFVDLARYSPIVPPNRENLFGKALFKGFDYDFVTALHLLTPQVENMVRYRLKQAGVVTTHRDRNGIVDEKGLSSLVESPEFEQSFGEDLGLRNQGTVLRPLRTKPEKQRFPWTHHTKGMLLNRLNIRLVARVGSCVQYLLECSPTPERVPEAFREHTPRRRRMSFPRSPPIHKGPLPPLRSGSGHLATGPSGMPGDPPSRLLGDDIPGGSSSHRPLLQRGRPSAVSLGHGPTLPRHRCRR